MSLRKAFAKVLAVGCTSVGLMALSGPAAQAAAFNLSYTFENGTAFSALINGELADDGNTVSVDTVASTVVTESDGSTLTSVPTSLAFGSTLTLDGGFVSFGVGDLGTDPLAEDVGFSLFNTGGIGGIDMPFADLGYTGEDGYVRFAGAFSYDGYELRTRVPESSTTTVLLLGLAGMGLAIAKKHTQQTDWC